LSSPLTLGTGHFHVHKLETTANYITYMLTPD
jgi:hypothetical protein